jgi:hypothetical protein
MRLLRQTEDLMMKFKKNENLAWRSIEGQIFIVDPKKSILHELNSVASRIWELIDGKRALKEISGQVCREFEVTSEEAEKDILELAEKLQEKELILTV